MKNEHITPEQQIENQKATIESLERKVESLEKELQRCLDPESGEINPSIRHRSGETALLEQINTLQKQLDDCLEPGIKFKQSHRFNAAAEAIIISLFQPISVFIPVESKSSGRYSEKDRKYVWSAFKDDLFESSHLENFWNKKEFRDGIELIIDVCIELETEFYNASKRPKDYGDIPYQFLYDDLDKKTKAVDSLSAALYTFYGREDIRMTPDDINDIALSLRTISLIQKSGGLFLISPEED